MRLCTLNLFAILILSGIAEESKHPGDWHRLEDVAAAAQTVCIAEFDSLGRPDLGPPGSTYYSNAVIKVSRTFIGEKFKILDCGYCVQTLPESKKEEAPKVGDSFLILGYSAGGSFAATKLVKPTAANIALVEKVLRARGLEEGSEVDGTPKQNDIHPPSHVIKPIKAAETKVEPTPTPSKPNETPTSSPSWSIIVVLIVAVLGLLWLLLKRYFTSERES